MDELIAFVRAQLDEDERVARDAVNQGGIGRNGEKHWTRCYSDRRALVGDQAGNVVIHGLDESWSPSSFQAEHIARWDPARVLAEVEVKRRILDEHDPTTTGACYTCCENGMFGGENQAWPCRTIRALVQPYAGQPGWREEWQA